MRGVVIDWAKEAQKSAKRRNEGNEALPALGDVAELFAGSADVHIGSGRVALRRCEGM